MRSSMRGLPLSLMVAIAGSGVAAAHPDTFNLVNDRELRPRRSTRSTSKRHRSTWSRQGRGQYPLGSPGHVALLNQRAQKLQRRADRYASQQAGLGQWQVR